MYCAMMVSFDPMCDVLDWQEKKVNLTILTMAPQQVPFFLTWQETCSCALCTACVRWSGSAYPLLSEGSSPWGPERFSLWMAGGHFVAHWNRGQQKGMRKQSQIGNRPLVGLEENLDLWHIIWKQLDYNMGSGCRDMTHLRWQLQFAELHGV